MQEYIDNERKAQFISKDKLKLPKVNKELALKLQTKLSLGDNNKVYFIFILVIKFKK